MPWFSAAHALGAVVGSVAMLRRAAGADNMVTTADTRSALPPYQRLEVESHHIIRAVVADLERRVMLHSKKADGYT